MVTDISASGRNWPKKHHTCGQNLKHRCAVFVVYIAQAQREALAAQLAKAIFFSIQADESTDSGNVEDKHYLAILGLLHKVRIRGLHSKIIGWSESVLCA